MKNKYLILIVLIMLVLPLINSLDNSIPISCGGNSEVLIGCLNSQDLVFLGNLVTSPSEKGGQQISPEVQPEKEIVYVPKEAEYPFFSIANLNEFLLSKGLGQLDIYILEFFIGGIFVCMLFLVFKKKKDKKKMPQSQSSHLSEL